MKLLILTSSTGGGHDLRANAIAAWAKERQDLGVETEIFRPLEASGALNDFGVNLYNQIQRKMPAAHHAYWSFLELAGLHRRPWQLSGVQPFVSKLESFRPDLIISVHAHLNHGYMELARRTLGQNKVKVGTYCGELEDGYGFSRHWVNPKADIFIGASEYCCGAAKRIGMVDEKNMLGGFMLRPSSYKAYTETEKAACLENHGLDPKRFTLLLATGAVGANNHQKLLEALDWTQLDMQVVALCGKGQTVLDELNAWKPRHSKILLKALPYIDEMPLMLASASALVARGGTGTTSEAILAGCPLIANGIGGVMPQEMITLKYLRHFGITEKIASARDLPKLIKSWTESPKSLDEAKERMKSAKPPGEPSAIIERLANL
ncbi:glycosyltransferase [Rubellicoccus peritrichatus]|uniref:Glycosyltransferase n=1 Tax=Rubellicoccus peritrichatus TaxID=3080537 RepID=A0AAQ3LIZ8_9BACT|nr:glycosyltransferase [Puniceicoccus sp. CR14]WOO43024.1 glycosyltransferase [Puniceicoccus sp. CR14]